MDSEYGDDGRPAPRKRFTVEEWDEKYKSLLQSDASLRRSLDEARDAQFRELDEKRAGPRLPRDEVDDFFKKMYDRRTHVPDCVRRARETYEEEFRREATFAPALDERSRSLCRSTAQLFEWQVLHNKWLIEQREKKKAEEDEEFSKLPFRPQIDPVSSHLARTWTSEGDVVRRLTSPEVMTKLWDKRHRRHTAHPVRTELDEMRDVPAIGERSQRYKAAGPVHDRLYQAGKSSISARNSAFVKRWREELNVDPPARHVASSGVPVLGSTM